jgi:hypothetical protein
MTDIDRPLELLAALDQGVQVAPLALDVEVLCERALRTRSRASLRAARVALSLEAADAKAARKPTARLLELRARIADALAELRAKGGR